MLGHRLRLWPNINPTLITYPVYWVEENIQAIYQTETHCSFNAGPALQMVVQHWNNRGSTSLVCCESDFLNYIPMLDYKYNLPQRLHFVDFNLRARNITYFKTKAEILTACLPFCGTPILKNSRSAHSSERVNEGDAVPGHNQLLLKFCLM